MGVIRIFVEKKLGYAVEAQHILNDLVHSLTLNGLKSLRLVNRYDVEGISETTFNKARNVIFSEPQVDDTFDELQIKDNEFVFGVEYLPEQYDQRADSCAQCIQLLTNENRPLVRTAKIFIITGDVNDEQKEQIKKHLINAVEAREALMEKPATLVVDYDIPTTVETVDGFIEMNKTALLNVMSEMGLAMDYDDIVFCQNYFIDEKRDPTFTEIKMIDTYWSDHCRHTTFSTIIEDANIEPTYIKSAFNDYLETRRSIYVNRQKDVTLMDIATMGMRYCKKAGLLNDLDESEEINACSVKIDVEVDGVTEKWLLMFKNETHNHPTEIEPFGGAATCLGGAIRDPLSGRSYVYQAMRVTGASDPTVPHSETLKGKLSQKKIVTTAANGYSSYGNQIGLATGLVNEIYHSGYVAKRMEIGAVVGATPYANVVREVPSAGDIVILLGGRTGRDGCGGASGSSKTHTVDSLANCGAEVQKGNPPEERKIQRLFRNPKVTSMIKRCNDFGAGGVSVAIGELADGLVINLNAVPKKYDGLDGTELAISESQERMAVVVTKENVDDFIAFANDENLEATEVAVVTEEPRLRLNWNDNTIVDLSREFLNSNGATKTTTVTVHTPKLNEIYDHFKYDEKKSLENQFKAVLSDLNVCSQKGLVERFDSTIGAGTVTLPYGGRFQLTPTPFMAAKIPVLSGKTDVCSVMSYGYNPYVSSQSPYHGAVCAVVASIAGVVSAGIDYKKVRLTLQEYFERTKCDPVRWGKPFAALLGAFTAQKALGCAAIGGKDSMSGSFENIDVPPTLVSFAIATMNASNVVTPEFKTAGESVYIIRPQYDENLLPNFASVGAVFDKVHALMNKGIVSSASPLLFGGIADTVSKMCFGNKLGFNYENNLDKNTLFNQCYGAIVIATKEKLTDNDFVLIGKVTEQPEIKIGNEVLQLEKLIEVWKGTLEPVFPTTAEKSECGKLLSYDKRSNWSPLMKVAKPRVFIPVFPGTNCEYDSARQFENAGAICNIYVIKNLTAAHTSQSVRDIVKLIDNSEIIMIPGGFSGGDEPEGSGKFIATFFRNPSISEAVCRLIDDRKGLIIGICNGFQALIKLGLLPFGKICEMNDKCPTLTFNSIGRHQSMMANTRISSVNSPWLSNVNVGDIHTIAISHGEGRFVAPQNVLDELKKNGQIITQYVDPFGAIASDTAYNPNNSMLAIEGIVSPDGRILGKMGHSERIGNNVAKNVAGNKDQMLFKSGVEYFR